MDHRDLKSTNTILLQILIVLLAALFMLLSRSHLFALLIFLLLYFILAYTVYVSKRLTGLVLIAALTSLILALRFKYLTWGDPWYEYAMAIRIIEHGSIASEFYPSQLPAVHLTLSSIAIFTDIDLIVLQKFVVPLISSISIIVLYKITKEFFNTDTAFLAGLLLLVGTPYLHWTAQAVRESVGIPMVLLALYFSFKTIKVQQVRYILASSFIICGLVLTHHHSSGIFIFSWLFFSLTYVYLACDMKTIGKTSIYSLTLLLVSLSLALSWWSSNLHGTFSYFEKAINLIFHSSHGLIIFIITLILLYALPIFSPNSIMRLRSLLSKILSKKREIYMVLLLIAICGTSLAVNFVMGKSFFVLNYPLIMMSNGVIMVVLAMIGLYYFLDSSKLPVISWLVAISLMLGLSMAKVIPFADPLRFMEFLYAPLAIISAIGLKQVADRIDTRRAMALLVATLMVVSLVTSFPSIVLSGKHFEPGDIRYDDRSWVISHSDSEIKSIKWLNEHQITGRIYTDTYVSYATQWINYDNNITLLNYLRINPDTFPKNLNNYAIITGRMKKYAEFGEWLTKERTPLQENEIQKLYEETNQIYDNGEAKTFFA